MCVDSSKEDQRVSHQEIEEPPPRIYIQIYACMHIYRQILDHAMQYIAGGLLASVHHQVEASVEHACMRCDQVPACIYSTDHQ